MCQPRSLTLDPLTIQIAHVWTRCVRRAFLCGFDPVTGRDYEHRRDWIRERIQWLAGIYAIDVVTFAVMSNHCHWILRSRYDVVAGWSDEEVARRVMRLEGQRWFRADGSDRKSTAAEVQRRVNDKSGLDQARARLSDISKWMQSLDQHIAAKANREDDARRGDSSLQSQPVPSPKKPISLPLKEGVSYKLNQRLLEGQKVGKVLRTVLRTVFCRIEIGSLDPTEEKLIATRWPTACIKHHSEWRAQVVQTSLVATDMPRDD